MMKPVKKLKSFRNSVIAVLALFSGGCALAYEILYMRALTNVFGDMFYVHAALLSTFLIGIGIGSKAAHRFVPCLFIFEIVTGAYALILPFLLKRFLSLSIIVEITACPILTIISVAAFLSIPCLMIGFSIPVFSAYLKLMTGGNRTFQRIYWIYNLGAVLSILTVEFVMVRSFGMNRSMYLVGFINIAIGIILYFMIYRHPVISFKESRYTSFTPSLIWALILGSFASAVFQMFILKLSYLVFEPHRENFAVAISVTMAGLCIGAWLASRFNLSFTLTLMLISLSVGVIFSNYLSILRFNQWASGLFYFHETLIIFRKLIISACFALVPMCCFGALIPTLMKHEKAVSHESGTLLFVSSISNAAGYLCYVLVFHPFLESQMVLAGICLLTLLAGLISVDFK